MNEDKTKDKAEYAITLTNEFAKAHGLTDIQAFRYLDRFNGIDFIIDHYEIAHTLSFYDMVVSLGDVCKRNGGLIVPDDIHNKEWLRKI